MIDGPSITLIQIIFFTKFQYFLNLKQNLDELIKLKVKKVNSKFLKNVQKFKLNI